MKKESICSMEVLNPRGEIELQPICEGSCNGPFDRSLKGGLNPTPKSNQATTSTVRGITPRVTDLAGKKIGLLDNNKQGSSNFLDAIQELLERECPSATILRMKKPHAGRIIYDAPEWYEKVAQEVDAFIYATGD